MTADLIAGPAVLWSRVASRLRTRVGDDQYEAWFKGIQCVDASADHIYLSAPTTFIKNWIQEHFAETVRTCVQDECPGIDYFGIAVRPTLHQIARPSVGRRSLPDNRNAQQARPAPVAALPAPGQIGNIPSEVLRAVSAFLAREGDGVEATERLLEFCRTEQRRLGEIARIQVAVAKHFDIRRLDILSSRRTANVIRPRQIAMYLAKQLTLDSLPKIGRLFGNRDHSTVLHAVRKIEALIQTDESIGRDVAILSQQLQEVLTEENHETV